MRIFGHNFTFTIVPAHGPTKVHELTADYDGVSLQSVLAQAGLKTDTMVITADDGTPIDPSTFKLKADVNRRSRPPRPSTGFIATECARGS